MNKFCNRRHTVRKKGRVSDDSRADRDHKCTYLVDYRTGEVNPGEVEEDSGRGGDMDSVTEGMCSVSRIHPLFCKSGWSSN